jgi:hypothetical protein
VEAVAETLNVGDKARLFCLSAGKYTPPIIKDPDEYSALRAG